MSNKTAILSCWRCGGSLKGISSPFSRRDECPSCRAELHVCRQCKHYNASFISQCGHDQADPPPEKDRANFCDYFAPSFSAYQKTGSKDAGDSQQKLAELFGENRETFAPEPTQENTIVELYTAREELKALHVKKRTGDDGKPEDDTISELRSAREELKALFDEDKKEKNNDNNPKKN